MFAFPGIGVVFDIEALGEGFYGYQAKKLFLQTLSPQDLGSGVLVEGDTNATLNGQAQEFCIGFYGSSGEFDEIREKVLAAEEPGFAPPTRRVMENLTLQQQSLCQWGKVDHSRRLVTEIWMRSIHDLCKTSGWGYAPEQVTLDLDEQLLAELRDLQSV